MLFFYFFPFFPQPCCFCNKDNCQLCYYLLVNGIQQMLWPAGKQMFVHAVDFMWNFAASSAKWINRGTVCFATCRSMIKFFVGGKEWKLLIVRYILRRVISSTLRSKPGECSFKWITPEEKKLLLIVILSSSSVITLYKNGLFSSSRLWLRGSYTTRASNYFL